MKTPLLVALLAALALAPMGALGHNSTSTMKEHVCGGTAPGTSTCDTGRHTYRTSVTVQCRPSATFTGIITVILTSDVAEVRERSCIVVNGMTVLSNGQGFWPLQHEEFAHACRASGAGAWGCGLVHD